MCACVHATRHEATKPIQTKRKHPSNSAQCNTPPPCPHPVVPKALDVLLSPQRRAAYDAALNEIDEAARAAARGGGCGAPHPAARAVMPYFCCPSCGGGRAVGYL